MLAVAVTKELPPVDTQVAPTGGLAVCALGEQLVTVSRFESVGINLVI